MVNAKRIYKSEQIQRVSVQVYFKKEKNEKMVPASTLSKESCLKLLGDSCNIHG